MTSPLFKSENAYLNNIVYVDVRGRDIGGYVEEASALVRERVELPEGSTLLWASGDRVLVRLEDELGVQRVELRALEAAGTP